MSRVSGNASASVAAAVSSRNMQGLCHWGDIDSSKWVRQEGDGWDLGRRDVGCVMVVVWSSPWWTLQGHGTGLVVVVVDEDRDGDFLVASTKI